MKKLNSVIGVMVVLLQLLSPAFALDEVKPPEATPQTAKPDELPPGFKKFAYKDGLFDVDVVDVSIQDLAKALSKVSGVEIEVFEGVTGKVTFATNLTPVDLVMKRALWWAKEENFAVESEETAKGGFRITKITVLSKKKQSELEKQRREERNKKVKEASDERMAMLKELDAHPQRFAHALDVFKDAKSSEREWVRAREYLNMMTPTPEEEEYLKNQLFKPENRYINNSITKAILNGMQAHPDLEKDPPFIVEVLNNYDIKPAWLLYALAIDGMWDDKMYPPLKDRFLIPGSEDWLTIEMLGRAGAQVSLPVLLQTLYSSNSETRSVGLNAVIDLTKGVDQEKYIQIYRDQDEYYHKETMKEWKEEQPRRENEERFQLDNYNKRRKNKGLPPIDLDNDADRKEMGLSPVSNLKFMWPIINKYRAEKGLPPLVDVIEVKPQEPKTKQSDRGAK